MNFEKFKQLFQVHRTTNDGKTIRAFWVSAEEEAALISPESGRLLAYVSHDGCRKYYPLVIVSPWEAFRLIRHEMSMLVSLLSFPRLTVELYRIKTDSLGEAQQEIEEYLNIKKYG